MVFPRRTSELGGQTATVSNTIPDYRDYDAIAAAVRGLNHVAKIVATVTEGTDHVTVTHNLHLTDTSPTNLSFLPCPTDDVGRVWYDMLTVTADTIDVYVANPPIGGSYVIPCFLFWDT